MPTLLDAVDLEHPGRMDGHSLLPLLGGDRGWRDYVHGECSDVPTLGSGQQYITDNRYKYIWYPGKGNEQLFDLNSDPCELHDIVHAVESGGELERLRSILVSELQGRPEGFVRKGRLVRLDGPTAPCLPQ